MSEANRSSDLGQWGRPLRRRVKYAAPKSSGADAAPVGPVDDPVALERAAIIVRAERPAGVAPTSFGSSPAASREREHAEPDDHDFALRDLVVHMAKGLVDRPEAVAVEILSAGSNGVLELRVDQDDMGHVIGKQGRTANSLRLALGAAARRIDRRVDLEIAD